MATVLSARKTRNVRNAARFPRSIPIVTYLYVHVSRFRVFFFCLFFFKGMAGFGVRQSKSHLRRGHGRNHANREETHAQEEKRNERETKRKELFS